MAWSTNKTNWSAADGLAAADMNRIEENQRILRTTNSVYETAGGSATAITLANVDLTTGASKTFVAIGNNNGGATTINGKALYKPGGTVAPTLIAGKAYTVWYNGTNFFIKASADGNAVAEHVLAGDIFSTDVDTGIVGTMTDNTGVSKVATAVASENGRVNLKPSAGYYDGAYWVYADDPDFVQSNILATKNIFGLQGSIPVKTGELQTASESIYSGNGGPRVYLRPLEGYWSGSAGNNIYSSIQANLVPENILMGKTIFNITGTLQPGKKFTSGVGTAPWAGGSQLCYNADGSELTNMFSYFITVSGLTFKPRVILLYPQSISTNSTIVMYMADSDGAYTDTVKLATYFTPGQGQFTNFNMKANGGYMYVNSSGFRIVGQGGVNITWLAFE